MKQNTWRVEAQFTNKWFMLRQNIWRFDSQESKTHNKSSQKQQSYVTYDSLYVWIRHATRVDITQHMTFRYHTTYDVSIIKKAKHITNRVKSNNHTWHMSEACHIWWMLHITKHITWRLSVVICPRGCLRIQECVWMCVCVWMWVCLNVCPIIDTHRVFAQWCVCLNECVWMSVSECVSSHGSDCFNRPLSCCLFLFLSHFASIQHALYDFPKFMRTIANSKTFFICKSNLWVRTHNSKLPPDNRANIENQMTGRKLGTRSETKKASNATKIDAREYEQPRACFGESRTLDCSLQSVMWCDVLLLSV